MDSIALIIGLILIALALGYVYRGERTYKRRLKDANKGRKAREVKKREISKLDKPGILKRGAKWLRDK